MTNLLFLEKTKFNSSWLIALAIILMSFNSHASNSITENELTLMAAVNATLENNNSLKSKDASLSAKKEIVEQAWSNLRPNISYQYQTGRSEYSSNIVDNEPTSFKRSKLSLVQTVFSRKKFMSLDNAESNVYLSQLELDLEVHTKVLELIEAYLDLSKYQVLVDIVKKEQADNIIKVERLEKMLTKGLATKMDLLEAQARYDSISSNLIKFNNDLKVRQKRLENLTGITVYRVTPPDNNLWQRGAKIISYKLWEDVVDKKSLFLQVPRQAVALAKSNVAIQQSEYWPDVNLRLDINKTDSYESSIENDKKLQLELNIPIYQGGIRSSKVKEARYNLDSQSFLLEDRKEFVRSRLAETLATLEGGLSAIKALEKSVLSNEAYIESAQKGLRYGLRGVFELLEGKARSYELERQLTEEVHNAILYQFELIYLIGELKPEVIESYLQSNFTIESLYY